MDDFSSLIADIASIYSTDTIFILGKGRSADEVRKEVFRGSLVIGLNDAERIAPTDITVFHAEWVKQGLRAMARGAQLYVTSTDFAVPGRRVLRVPHHPLTQESSDLVMQRFLTDELALEDILFLTALKIARKVAEARGRPQTVYMVGFDFRPETGYSHEITTDYAPQSADERQARISQQEFYFLNTLYFLQQSNLVVKHVGTRAFSAIAPEDLNRLFLGSAAVPDAPRHAVAVVAELTTNHFGDRARLERMIRAVRAAGADLVKLQKRDVETFYRKEQLDSAYRSPFGRTFGDYRRQLELSAEDFAFVDALCRELGLGWFASLLDQPSFEFMQQFAPTLVKLPSTISEHRDYLAHVARSYRHGVVLSTGMTDQAYERWVLETFTNCERLYLMQANSAYPTPLHECNIGVVRHYDHLSKQHRRIVPAYSSHDLGWKGSALAVAAGARMVEKHVKLGNTEWAHFDAVAVDLTTPKFREYVEAIREAELITGSEEKRVNPTEHHKYFVRATG
ncbi:N-acetylneuraminate synthase family protein [Falsiroseomonas tokyonensis]|uniref:N-acetylneuraminate synthase family protein n=1 Tax=Falsiroseomonas tokyonensis TaxID=430521 RepID=A0ABV7BUA0_9PROT|nr:N-acetylneuraminate synthase family protein [Falsiroseomonas tokyonensis]MBU8538434.1 N-acetylneuraminate synthase family protein [Falsiroseomonas tokyonensis]